ncbi:MAG TPA: hypothetical protein VJR89_43195 [Polyangiales bacterium]|nr:hypothetical protein [Polyangiales bacterium]
MKDPARLLDMPGSAAELRLLRAAVCDEPPPEAAERLLSALGVPGSAPGAFSAGGGAAGVTLAAASGSKLWLVLALCGVAGLAGLVVWTARPVSSPPMAAEAPAPSPAQPAPQPLAAAPSVPADARVSLADEIARLDAVRRSLASGQARAALAGLDRYAELHAAGALQQEAALLRIEALQRAGHAARARALAARFLAEHPDSPHAPRVRALQRDVP